MKRTTSVITKISSEQTYPLRHKVMWPNKPQEYVHLENDFEGIHFGLWFKGELVSVVSLFIDDDEAQFRKFATDVSLQSNGYGTTLLNYLMNYVSQGKTRRIWCNARKDKSSFYEKFGMHKTPKTFTKGNIEYIIMEKIFY